MPVQFEGRGVAQRQEFHFRSRRQREATRAQAEAIVAGETDVEASGVLAELDVPVGVRARAAALVVSGDAPLANDATRGTWLGALARAVFMNSSSRQNVTTWTAGRESVPRYVSEKR